MNENQYYYGTCMIDCLTLFVSIVLKTCQQVNFDGHSLATLCVSIR